MKSICFFLGCAVCLSGLAAQSLTQATVSGIVSDQSGAPVPGAGVSVLNADRNQAFTTQTKSNGAFRVPSVGTGLIEVRVTAPRFAVFVRRFSISTGQAIDLPIRLALETRSETVTVAGSAPLLEPARTQIASSVLRPEIDSLPLNGRNYLDLALLAPGVSRTNTGVPQQFAETSAIPGTGISFAGQRNLSNSFVVDGLSANDDAAGLTGSFFSQEVIQEFQVVTASASAEFGRASAGVVSIATRSGTNSWHARLYGFLRNHRMDARHALSSRKDAFTQAQYGASTGGPLRRDRIFFFGNVERTGRNAAGYVAIQPAAAAAINRRLDELSYLGPRLGTGVFPTGYHSSTAFGRLDRATSEKRQLAFRYSLYSLAGSTLRGAGGLNAVSRGTGLETRDHAVAVHHTAISQARLNETRAQFARSRLAAPGNDTTGPAVNIAGVANFGASTTSPTGRDAGLAELSHTFTATARSHVVKAGVDLLLNRVNIVFPGSLVAGVYAFGSLADFLASRFITYQQAFGEPAQLQTNTNAGVFLYDEYRATNWLTLNAGVRYDVQRLPHPLRTDRNNLAPRFGISFAPGDRRTVVRASYGLYYDRIPLRATSNALHRDGARYRTALLAFGQSGAPWFPEQMKTFPEGQFVNITTIDPRIGNSYSQQATIQIERSVSGTTVISAGYEWLRGLHLLLSRNANVPTLSASEAAARGIPNLGRADSRYGNIGRYESSGDSYYNGLSLAIRSRLSSLGELRLAYNYSKAIDNAGNFFFSSPQNNFNLRDDRGLSDNDQRHRLTLSGTFEARFRHALLKPLTAWRISPIFSYSSALPFNIQTGNDRNFDTNNNDRPAGIGRNTGRGFDYVSLDFRLSRTFRLRDRVRLEWMAESFNALNRANFTAPNNIFGAGMTPSPQFARATAAHDPRQTQLGIRLDF